jgi:hypothetical protein
MNNQSPFKWLCWLLGTSVRIMKRVCPCSALLRMVASMHLERCLEIFSLDSIHALHFSGHRSPCQVNPSGRTNLLGTPQTA